MTLLATVLVALAALLHGYIFLMESLWWTRPAIWRRFGIRDQGTAEVIAPMAYNQGFYNLFLGVGAALGLVLFHTGSATAGRTLVLFTTASMALAAVVLVSRGSSYLRAALTQGTLPLLGFVTFLLLRPWRPRARSAAGAGSHALGRVVGQVPTRSVGWWGRFPRARSGGEGGQ